MPGYFTVSLTPPTTPSANQVVELLVASVNGYKGSVTVTFSCSDPIDPPIYIDPTSEAIYVPQSGSGNGNVTVGLSGGQSIVLEALASDGTISSAATCVVSN